MNYRTDIGTSLVNGLVKGKFGRRLIMARHGTIRVNADDILALQGALVNGTRGHPDVSFPVQDRDVAPGGSGHPRMIDPPDDLGDLIAGVLEFGIQLIHFTAGKV